MSEKEAFRTRGSKIDYRQLAGVDGYSDDDDLEYCDDDRELREAIPTIHYIRIIGQKNEGLEIPVDLDIGYGNIPTSNEIRKAVTNACEEQGQGWKPDISTLKIRNLERPTFAPFNDSMWNRTAKEYVAQFEYGEKVAKSKSFICFGVQLIQNESPSKVTVTKGGSKGFEQINVQRQLRELNLCDDPRRADREMSSGGWQHWAYLLSRGHYNDWVVPPPSCYQFIKSSSSKWADLRLLNVAGNSPRVMAYNRMLKNPQGYISLLNKQQNEKKPKVKESDQQRSDSKEEDVEDALALVTFADIKDPYVDSISSRSTFGSACAKVLQSHCVDRQYDTIRVESAGGTVFVTRDDFVKNYVKDASVKIHLTNEENAPVAVVRKFTVDKFGDIEIEDDKTFGELKALITAVFDLADDTEILVANMSIPTSLRVKFIPSPIMELRVFTKNDGPNTSESSPASQSSSNTNESSATSQSSSYTSESSTTSGQSSSDTSSSSDDSQPSPKKKQRVQLELTE